MGGRLRARLDDEARAAFAALPLEERFAACVRAGRLQAEVYARQHGVTFDEAVRRLEREKQRGRTPCSFLDRP